MTLTTEQRISIRRQNIANRKASIKGMREDIAKQEKRIKSLQRSIDWIRDEITASREGIALHQAKIDKKEQAIIDIEKEEDTE